MHVIPDIFILIFQRMRKHYCQTVLHATYISVYMCLKDSIVSKQVRTQYLIQVLQYK